MPLGISALTVAYCSEVNFIAHTVLALANCVPVSPVQLVKSIPHKFFPLISAAERSMAGKMLSLIRVADASCSHVSPVHLEKSTPCKFLPVISASERSRVGRITPTSSRACANCTHVSPVQLERSTEPTEEYKLKLVKSNPSHGNATPFMEQVLNFLTNSLCNTSMASSSEIAAPCKWSLPVCERKFQASSNSGSLAESRKNASKSSLVQSMNLLNTASCMLEYDFQLRAAGVNTAILVLCEDTAFTVAILTS